MLTARFRTAALLSAVMILRGTLAAQAQDVVAYTSPTEPEVSYVNGQLRVHALGLTLAQVLARVAGAIGVKLDIPAGAGLEPMPVIELGPGPARDVLGSLLTESNLDFVIQGSAADSGRVQSVLLFVRDRRSAAAVAAEASARTPRSPYARVRPEETAPPENAAPALENAAPAPPENASADIPAVSTPSEGADAPQAARIPQPIQSSGLSGGSVEQLNGQRIAPMSPPVSLTQQNITQQLQQMYQQRMQMQPNAATSRLTAK
jgi:hypothetical protein